MGQREGPDICDHGEAVGPIYSVDAVNVAAADVGADHAHQDVGRVADERDIHRSSDGRDSFG